MKKNFKKSKFVIVPALATLLLTGVASVTGTVAWFTASNAVTFTGSNFEVSTLDGNLTVSATVGTGTTDANATTAGNITVSGKMLDASYNGEQVFTDVPDTDPVKFKEVGMASEVTGYFYAVTWTETFSTPIQAGDTSTYNIYFNPTTSTVEKSTASTRTGLRISMTCGNNRIVWAPFVTSADAASTGYVNTVSAKATYTASSTDASKTEENSLVPVFGSDINTTTTWTLDSGDNVDASKRFDYLGTTTTESNATETKLDVTFVAWYEGLDGGITGNPDSNDLASIIATLGFYSRLAHKAN